MADNGEIISIKNDIFIINVEKFSDNLVSFNKSDSKEIIDISKGNLKKFLRYAVELFEKKEKVQLSIGSNIDSLNHFKKWLYKSIHIENGIDKIVDSLIDTLKSNLSKYHYKYELKKENNKESIDLQKHAKNIENAVSIIFENDLINISVYKDYFEFDLTNPAENKELRKMGKEIAAIDSELNDLKADYGYSTQLFIRKNDN